MLVFVRDVVVLKRVLGFVNILLSNRCIHHYTYINMKLTEALQNLLTCTYTFTHSYHTYMRVLYVIFVIYLFGETCCCCAHCCCRLCTKHLLFKITVVVGSSFVFFFFIANHNKLYFFISL